MGKPNFLIIHGHFYQPPRENPWLECVEPEFSAYPFHDWNERITRECYAPNAWARIHTPRLKIEKLVNNFAHISFDMGPTLISWICQNQQRLYEKLLEADRLSKELYAGHGTAMAQVYNHMIMPLADRKDKETQIKWGIEDFMHRFKRHPEGMWLAEAAVDTETLEILAQEGIRFTILSPFQAERARPISRKGGWQDVSDGSIDVTMPYRAFLPSGRHIDIFFYNKEISQAIAFGNALSSGEQILKEVTLCLFKASRENGVVTIATDGESYGHHFKFGELALAWMIENAAKFHITFTSPGYYLEMFPPTWEVEIKERSSWSCAHGVKRWEDDCGCSVSGRRDWNQRWRKPLREGLNWLRDQLRGIFEKEIQRVTGDDPYALRNSYIKFLLEREEARVKGKVLYPPYPKEALRLLESQRMAMYMFTSCGWFFDDITGIEATQVLKYALRAIELVRPYEQQDLLAGLMEYLAQIRPNDLTFKDGKEVFNELVRPASYSMEHLAASAGVCSLFGTKMPDFLKDKVTMEREMRHSHRDTELAIGQVKVQEYFGEAKDLLFVLCLHKSHLAAWAGEGSMDGGMEQLILQGLGIRSQQKSVITQLREFIGTLRELDPMSLPKELIYHLIIQKPNQSRSKPPTIDAGKILYGMELLERKTKREDFSQIDSFYSSHLRDLITGLISKFLTYDTVSANDIGLKKLLSHLKVTHSLVDKGKIVFYATNLVNTEALNLVKKPTRHSVRRLIHYLKLHRLLQLDTDLFYLQSYWWDLSQRKEILEGQSDSTKRLFWKLGEALGFQIKK